MSSMTVSEARAALPEIVERVLAGEEITLTRHGVAVAVVVHPDALKVRRADAALARASAVQELLERGRRRPVGSGPGLSEERAERLVADVRATPRSSLTHPLMDAFDADVLIYAAAPGHPLGRRIARLFAAERSAVAGRVGIGSVLLLPELLSRPMREDKVGELDALGELLGRLELWPVDQATAALATALAAAYGLRAADAVHLATAVNAGADRFLTNNRKDFKKSISEIDIVYPADLPTG